MEHVLKRKGFKNRVKSSTALFMTIVLLVFAVGCSQKSASSANAEPLNSTNTSNTKSIPESSEMSGEGETVSNDVKATIKVLNWGNLQEAEAYNKAIGRFNQKYPNVKVINNLTPVASWSDYVDKWMTQVASGDSPDVINIAIEGARLAVDKELLMPLNQYIDVDESAKKHFSEVPQPLIDAFTVDGSTYLMPNGWQTMVMYYNTKIFKEKGIEPPSPDWTWDDFLSIAQKLTYGEGSSKVYGFGQSWGFFQLSPWWITNGTSPITGDYQGSNLKDPKFVETLQFISDLFKKYKVSPDPIGIDVYSQFASGNLAMVGGGRWPLKGWKDSNFQDFDIVPWPKKETSGTVFGTAGWGIGKSTENKELAWELIKEFESVETLRQNMEIGQQIPALESLSKEASFLATPPANVQLLWSVLDKAKPVAAPVFFRDMEQVVMRNMENVMSGSATPEKAMEQAHKELEGAIK